MGGNGISKLTQAGDGSNASEKRRTCTWEVEKVQITPTKKSKSSDTLNVR